MNEQQQAKTFAEDGIRPIENSELEIINTFEEDGTRPIAESPDFLVSDRKNQDRHLSNQKAIYNMLLTL